MSRRRRRGRASGGAVPIRFENLDGSPEDTQMEDDERVNPLDLGRDAPVDEDADPRAGDPFADDVEDADDKLEDVSDEEVDDETEVDEEPDDIKALRAELAAERKARADIEREREEARRELEETRKNATEARTKRLDEELEAVEGELERAIEEGESKKQAQLYRKIAQLESEKRDLGRAPVPQKTERQASPGGGQMVTINGAAATAWAAGKTWINNSAYEAQNRDLIRVAQAVAEDGLDPTSKPYYEELERRLKLRHPSLFPAAQKPPATQRRPGQQTVGRVSRDDPPQNRAATKKVVLTSKDISEMKIYGLDPQNKEHVLEWAKGKAA